MGQFAQVWAYCGQRAADRHSTKGVRVHAVTWSAKMSGALDAECGEQGVIPVGDWEPGMAHACPDCVRILAADAPVVVAPAVVPPPRVSRRHRIIHRRRVVVSADQLAAELAA